LSEWISKLIIITGHSVLTVSSSNPASRLKILFLFASWNHNNAVGIENRTGEIYPIYWPTCHGFWKSAYKFCTTNFITNLYQAEIARDDKQKCKELWKKFEDAAASLSTG
ncbi:hypothetical protein FGIG_11822, partial [Fasciola gigantica]